MTADLGEYLNEFILPEERVLRHEHFYLMRLTDATPGEPHFDSANADEARFRPRWAANLAEAEAQITFASEREFVARARKLEAGRLEAGCQPQTTSQSIPVNPVSSQIQFPVSSP